jgi:hypothetical protein
VKVETTIVGVTEGAEALKLTAIIDKTNLYAQANYPQPEQIDELLVDIYPLMSRTKSYQLASPLWKGEKWLHIAFPESSDEAEVDVDWRGSDEAKKMAKDLFLAIKPGKIELNYGYEGENYTKVSFGFRKDRLIKAIDNLKDLNVDLKVSQINSMIEIVESSDDWDRDLLTFLIDKKGDLRVIVMQLPQIDEQVLSQSIAEGSSSDQTGLVAGLVSGFKGMVWQEEGELVSLGSVHFGRFDQVEEVDVPTELVEGTVLWETITREFGPIIGQMLSGMSEKSAPVQLSPYTTLPSGYPVATVNPGVGKGRGKSK